MLSLNRGEWSELYATLFLLLEPKISIVDNNLNIINNEIFEIEKIIISSNKSLKYEVVDDFIIVYMNSDKFSKLKNDEIKNAKDKILYAINNNNDVSGSFQIASIDKFLKKFSHNNIIKAKSFQKEDIEVLAKDNKKKRDVNLKYSVKSSLGSPATLLNSSKHTDFRYKVSNLKDIDIDEINQLNGRTKLLDRIKEIEERDGIIVFDKVLSETFEYNLKMIDEKMPLYLANALLSSYVHNIKDLKEIFLNSSIFEDNNFDSKKLSDLLCGICFSFVPSVKWSGEQIVNGGFILIKKDGKVVVLDLIYYKNYVLKYLIENTKLDSPSSTRYHMLELYKENGNIYFTLNLQIRYKQ